MVKPIPETFCIFILSHGRPDCVWTYNSLVRAGYSGRLYIVIDNEDASVNDYIFRFGREVVLTFDKKRVADTCDEGNNFDNRNVILMARNACFDLANDIGVTHFIQLDDDYYYFGYRFDTGAKKIKDINGVFVALLDFYNSTNTTSIAFSQGGDHIGGFSGIKLKRKCMNSFLCSTNRPFKFVGSLNEDVNTYTTLGSRGHLFFTFTGLQLDQKDTQSQAGGITDAYLKLGTYAKSFTSTMMMPSSVKVAMMHTKNQRLHHSIDWGRTVPCIIGPEHKLNL